MAKVSKQTTLAGADALLNGPDIRTVHDQLTRQAGRVQRNERVEVRIMDTVMGWIFVVGLIIWTYVSRSVGSIKSQRAAREDS